MVVATQKADAKLGLRILEAAKKLKENGLLFDCLVKAEGREFPAHSLLLAANSESMKKEIIGGEREIVFKGVKPETVERCMGLIYGEHGEDLEGSIGDILQVSSKIKLDGVKDFCFDFMEGNLTVQNCFTTVERAKSYDRTEVLQLAEKFITENFKAVIGTKEFLLLSKEDLLHYIQLSNADHQVLWKAVIRWIGGTKQDKILPELMNAININNFPIEFLMETVWKEPRVQNLAEEIVILSSDLERLKENMSTENCFSIKSFNEAHNTINQQAVKIAVTRFMAENLAQIKDKEEFLVLDFQDLTEILQASELSPAMEKWEAIVRWTKCDSNQEIYFSQLVVALGIESFAFDFLLGVIWEEPLVQKSNKLKQKLTEILFSSKQKFEDNIDVGNCFILTNMNLKFNSVNCEAVAEMLRNFMASSFERIIGRQEYLKLEKDDVVKVVKNAEISEMTKWQGLIKWIYFQKSREDYLQEMISALKLEEFFFNFLLEQVYNEPLVQKFESVKLKVIDCLLSDPQKLQQNIAKENCLALKRMLDETSTARQHSEAKKIVNRHVMFNLESVILESEFPYLRLDSFISIFQSLQFQSDSTKWESVLRWVKHDTSREVCLPRLIEILDIQDPPFLLKAVWKEPLVQDCEAAKASVITAALFCDVTKLHAMITTKNCFFIVNVNKKQNSSNVKEVREALVNFMAKNFQEISERPGFMALTKKDVARMLKLTRATPMEKWQAVIKWIKFDESRENHLEEMMRAAKVNEFTFDFLLQTVNNEPLVWKSVSASLLVLNALFLDHRRLEESITKNNCLELKQLLDETSTKQDDAKKIVHRYLALNLGCLSEHPGFLELNFEGIVSLFKVHEIIAQSDETKWKSALRWVKHENSRDVLLPQLLDILKIQDFSFLLSIIWEDSLVQKSEEAKMSVVKHLFADLRKLEANITVDNCFQLQDLNDAYSHVNRDDAGGILTLFAKYFGKVEFLEFDERNLTNLIMSPDMKASVRVRFEAIIKWVKHDEARKGIFPRLFKLLDLKALDIRYVRDVMLKDPLVMNLQKCLLYSCLTDGGQHPSLAIFDKDAKELSILDLEDEISHNVSIRFGDLGSFRSMVTLRGEVYLVTDGSIWNLQNDGRIITLQHLKDVQLHSKVFTFQEKIYIIQSQKGKTAFCFDPADNSLIDGLPKCGLGAGFCVSTTKDFIYAMGGLGTNSRAKRFDARTQTWSGISDMRRKRWNAVAATLDGKIYVMGGVVDDRSDSSVECYCPESNSWTEISNLTASVFILSACVFNGRLYAFGRDRRKENGCSIEVYDKRLDQWIKIAQFETKCWSKGFACIWPHDSFKSEIDPSGGKILLRDCTIILPPHALSHQTELRASTLDPEDDTPDDLLPISPTLQLAPNMDLEVPAEVNLQTWATSDDSEAYVYFRETSNSPWEDPRPITVLENGKTKFKITKFCEYRIFILAKSVLKWSFRLQSCLFGNKDTKKLTNRVTTDCTTSTHKLEQEMSKLKFMPLCSGNPTPSAKVGDEIEVCVQKLKTEQNQEQNLPAKKIKITKTFLRRRKHEVQDFPLPIESKGIVKFTHTVQLYRQDQPHREPAQHEEDRINLGLPKPPATAIGKSNTGEYSATTHGESVQVHQEIHYH